MLPWEKFIQEYEFLKMPYSVSLRPFIKNAKGVFTHAAFFAENLENVYNTSVGYSYIPCVKKQLPENNSNTKFDEIVNKAREQEKFIIVSTGLVNPVKRNDKILAVLNANDKLRSKICYIMIGECDRAYYENLSRQSGKELGESVFIMGRQPYSVMYHAIKKADLCLNLRYPNREVCSLSLLEQMECGKATLVFNSGFYNEIPDDTVIKLNLNPADFLPPEYNFDSEDHLANCREIAGELNAIENMLLKLINNEINIEETGLKAAQFVHEYATKETYARKFIDFIKTLEQKHATAELKSKFLSTIANHSESLFGNLSDMPHYTDNMIFNINRLFNRKTSKSEKSTVITLGIWYAFPGKMESLDREGISVFTGKLCEALVNGHDINLEVWVYSWNIEPITRVFANIPAERIKIVTEQSFAKELYAETHLVKEFGNVDEQEYWRFAEAARLFSKADLFMPVIIYLDDVVYTGKPVVSVIHDLFPVYLREMFAATEHGNEIYHDTLERITNLARKNAFFVIDTVSTYVNQVILNVKNLHKSNTKVIPMPKNTPANIEYISEAEVRDLIGTQERYLFYPTQIRPHKNFRLLLSAFAILLKKYPELKLVLTGNLRDVPDVLELSKKLGIEDSIIHVSRLTPSQLFSCYKYAACSPVSSMHEAALSLQAVEAMCTGTPVVFTDADINRDEIEAAGFIEIIPLIPGDDADGFAAEIEYVMNNRDAAALRQEPLLEALTKYTWEDAASKYYEVFLSMLM